MNKVNNNEDDKNKNKKIRYEHMSDEAERDELISSFSSLSMCCFSSIIILIIYAIFQQIIGDDGLDSVKLDD